MNGLNDFIDVLRSRVSIVDVVSRRVKLTKKGHNYVGLCPFHHEKTGSFTVDSIKGFYHCFGCGESGNIFNFVMKSENIGFMEAVERIAEFANLAVPKFKHEATADESKTITFAMNFIKNYYEDKRKNSNNKKLADYISLRGISNSSLEKFEIGYADSYDLYKSAISSQISQEVLQKTGVFYQYNGLYKDKFQNRLIFPISDQFGKCIGFGGRSIEGEEPKYLNSPETDIFKKSDNLYGYHLAKKGKYKDLILVEGYMDVVTMHDAGFDKTVACLGTTISERQIELCWKITDAPIVMLDGDLAGIKGAHRWLLRILPKLQPGKTFRFVKIPNDNDPDSAIKQGGVQYMVDIIKTAVSLQDWLWNSSFILRPTQTPEDTASVLKYILDAIESIQDDTIKSLYKTWFSQKKRDFLFKRSYRNKSKNEQDEIKVSAIPSKMVKFQEILLVTIINHPNILDSVIESFISLDFQNSSYSWIQKEIIKEYEKNNNIENVIKKIYNKGVFMQANLRTGFWNKNSSDENALEGWTNTLDKYIKFTSGKSELGDIVSELEKSLSYSDWQRFKAVKSALLKNKRNDL